MSGEARRNAQLQQLPETLTQTMDLEMFDLVRLFTSVVLVIP